MQSSGIKNKQKRNEKIKANYFIFEWRALTTYRQKFRGLFNSAAVG